jgi:hypothetical protein
MGMHARIHQFGPEVSIALEGNLRAAEVSQLQAILVHFRSRGCRTFLLDMSRMAPLTVQAKASLRSLICDVQPSSDVSLPGSAIRLLADSPAAHPQTGCGGLTLSAA